MAGLFKTKTPALPEPTPMVDETVVKKARAAAIARTRSTSGRDSTILGQADKLGA